MPRVFKRNLSPELSSLVCDYRTKPTALTLWFSDASALALIQRLRDSGETAAIGELMHFGVAQSAAIRTAARSAIHQLLQLISLEMLPLLDDALRPSWYGDHQSEYSRLAPEALDREHWASAEDRTYLALLTCHRSGFIRAISLRRISAIDDARLVPFVLLRLTDWVNAVRADAREAFAAKLHPSHASAFVNCLPLLVRLEKQERFAPSDTAAIDRFLSAPPCADELRQGLRHQSPLARRHCFRLALNNPLFDAEETIRRAFEDTDVGVRRWALETRPDAWRDALADPHPSIRRIAFETLSPAPSTTLDDLHPFLLDRSRSLRAEAQDVVMSRFTFDPATYYRAKLAEPVPSKVAVICIIGLAETGARADGSTIAAFRTASSAKVRFAALRALRSLKAISDGPELLAIIAHEVPVVACEAARILLEQGSATPQAIWLAAQANPEPRVRLGVLRSFRKVTKWTRLRLYLDAALDPFPEVAAVAIDELLTWERKYNASFTQPSSADRRELPAAVTRAGSRLPPELHRRLLVLVAAQ